MDSHLIGSFFQVFVGNGTRELVFGFAESLSKLALSEENSWWRQLGCFYVLSLGFPETRPPSSADWIEIRPTQRFPYFGGNNFVCAVIDSL
jgi:hypothetical protein